MTDEAVTDARSSALMQALQAGRDAALAGLIELWQEPLLRFVFRYAQSEVEAREIVHEAFVRVHSQRAKFRGGQSFRSWVLTIAANLARNRRRWWRRHPSTAWQRSDAGETPTPEAMCPAPPPDHALMQGERVRAVRAAVERLPHELKVALLLHEYEGLGYREIAAVLGCSERGVETRLTRARQRMRAELGGFLRAEEGPVTAAAH
jgi:RNA polymerase sigma-70 factor (ECF subfamily)